MKSYLTDFNENSKALAEQDRAQAVDDLNAERSGLSTGRQTRFLHDTAHDSIAGNKRGKDGAGDMLDLALLSAMSFDELYDYAGDQLRDAETATERALAQAEDNFALSTTALQTTLGRAATLDDGTRVFRDADDQVWTERREAVDPALAATVEWQGFEPSFETLVIRQDAVTHDQDRIDAIRGYQIRLGEHRETYERDDLTRSDIEELIDDIQSDIPFEVSDQLEVRQDIDEPDLSAIPIPRF